MVKRAVRKTKEIRGCIEKWRSYFSRNIENYHYMHGFVLGKQWTDDETREMLKTFRKIALSSNKLGTMYNTLVGEQQQNTPQLEVVPLSSCDEQTASLRELIVKDITLGTDANIAYQVAAGQSFVGGYSAFGWGTRHTHDHSFDLEMYPFYFKDATKTYFDVSAETINKTDGMVAGYLSYMSRRKFRDLYGKKVEEQITESHSGITASREEVLSETDSSRSSNENLTWADKDAIAIINHFERKATKQKLYRLSNKEIYNQEELDEIIEKSIARQAEQMTIEQDSMAEFGEEPPPELMEQALGTPDVEPESSDLVTLYVNGEPVVIEDTREITVYKVKHYQCAGEYILDETDFPSQDLPIIFIDNSSWYSKDGKQHTRSFFQDAVDIQRYINYLRTQSAYILKISRYDQFIGSKKNVASNDTQAKWRDPFNVQGILTFDESPTGVVPQQLQPPELSQSLLSQYQLAVEDLYTSTGLYPTRMGEQGNEISGAAIDARSRQGSYSTYSSFNSVNRGITAGGNVVNQMVPHVFDTERVISLMFPDKGRRAIIINQQLDEYGEVIENDIRKGTFEVRLKAGPSYEGQKQEALMALQQVFQQDPEAFRLLADLFAENLPLSNSLEIKNRLKTLVPPQVIEAGKTGEVPQQEEQPNPEQQALEMQAQMNQMQLQIKMQELQLKEKELAMKLQEQEMKSEIEREKLETERLTAATELEEVKLRYLAETERTQSDSAIAHADNMTKILTHLK